MEMGRWRVGVGVLIVTLVIGPLLMPFVELAGDPAAWSAWRDGTRLVSLTRTTLLLVAAVLAIDVPFGTLLAVILYRSDLPGRVFLRRVVVVSLFVPLPLFATAWQAALGSRGWLGPADPGRPWAIGLWAAVFIHAAAGLPWVIWLVGQGLCWVEPEIEEDALLVVPPTAVLRRVTLRRALPTIVAASAWVALLTAQEITVTDLAQVRTFAEEVYTQFVLPDPTLGLIPDVAIARAVAIALPGTIVLAAATAFSVWRWEYAVPPLGSTPDPRILVRVQSWRWVLFPAVTFLIAALVVVPIGSLVWTMGLHGFPEEWSIETAKQFAIIAGRAHSTLIAVSAGAAICAGIATSTLAWLGCWTARQSTGMRVLLVIAVALAWATPGPVVGAGIKSAIDVLVSVENSLWGSGLVRRILYDGPSMAPVVWASIVRFFPCAVALLWPAVRMVPQSLADAARVDGATPMVEVRHAYWPLTAGAFATAIISVAILSLGELSASKLVRTPGGESFALTVFMQMHYGVANQLAAMCLLLLAMTLAPTGLFLLVRRLSRSKIE